MTQRIFGVPGGIAAFIIGAASASAQTISLASPTEHAVTPQDSDKGALADIVVTAQRREQRLQDVPVAVSAVSPEGLARSNVSGITDLKLAVPAFNATNSAGYLAPRLRGIGSTAVGPGIESSVALYVDGVYYAASIASFLSLNNVERVEVLKGPQGTLFGRNSTGGLLQIVTRTPTQQRHADFSLSYANYDRIEANGYVSGAITDTVSADLAVHVAHQGDGWGRNLGTGNDTYAVKHDLAVRSKLVFDPGGQTKITLAGDYADTDNSLNSNLLLPGTSANAGEVPVRYPGRWDSNTNHDAYTRGWQAGGSSRIDQKVGSLSLMSITAFRKSHFARAFDFDLTANPRPNPNPAQPYRYFIQPQPDRQFSQELQLSSPGHGAFTWVFGGYYFNARSGYDPLQIYFDAPFAPVAPQGQVIRVNSTVGTRSLAGFGQGTLSLGQSTNFTLGARYTHEVRSIAASQDRALTPSGAAAPIAAIPPQPNLTFNKPSLRVAIDHHFNPSIMAYASFNRGFKSGGFTAGSPAAPGYKPEELDAYELGIKSDLFDRRLRLNMAGFYYNYTNIQIQTVTATGTAQINGPSATIYGLDLDFDIHPVDRLAISGGLQLTDDRFGDYPNALISSPLGGSEQVFGSATGNRLPLTSRATLSVAPKYMLPLLSGGMVEFTATFYHNSGWYAAADNVIRQPAFNQYGASVRWSLPNEHLSLTAWGKNLSNVRTFAAENTVPGGRFYTVWDAPRTFGITLAGRY